jgi:hypothetical protein
MTMTQGEAHRDGQRARLAEVAEKTPVTRAVRAGTEIGTTVARA